MSAGPQGVSRAGGRQHCRMDAAVAAAGGRVKHSTHRDLISGKKRGPLAQAALWGLSVASFFYGAAVRLRNRAFRPASVAVASRGGSSREHRKSHRRRHGQNADGRRARRVVHVARARPVILSRGYRSLSDAANDEKLVLAQLCPNVVHLQSPDRVASAAQAYTAHHAEVLLLDDGFQHRRLARDLDIVLIDALDPWGRGHLLPRGLLREPRTALKRADLVLLTRADQLADEHKKRLLNEIRSAWNGRLPVEVVFRPVGLINTAGETRPIDSIAGTVAAFCGIGNPEAFRRSLETAGFLGRLLGPRAFEDHHHYAPSDLAALAELGSKRRCLRVNHHPQGSGQDSLHRSGGRAALGAGDSGRDHRRPRGTRVATSIFFAKRGTKKEASPGPGGATELTRGPATRRRFLRSGSAKSAAATGPGCAAQRGRRRYRTTRHLEADLPAGSASSCDRRTNGTRGWPPDRRCRPHYARRFRRRPSSAADVRDRPAPATGSPLASTAVLRFRQRPGSSGRCRSS